MTEYDDPIVGEIKAAVSFPVSTLCEAYPDVIFNVLLKERADLSAKKTVVCALENFVRTYNKRHFLRPIHYVSDIDSLPDPTNAFSVCVHIDFGNANPRALVGAVKALADTALPIYRIILE